MNPDSSLSAESEKSTGPASLLTAASKSESYQFAGPEGRRLRFMKARELEKKFDAGEDITKYLNLSNARRPGQEQKRVNVDFPVWMIRSLDKEARRLGVPRQSLIKVLIAQHLEKAHA
jgi:macrodomain Ter protein organizer (MatP/YcbG family)